MRGSKMKKILLAILLLAIPLAAKDKDVKSKYAVNCDDPHSYACTQYLRLELKQQKVLQSYKIFQDDLAALNAEAETVKKENGWPETVQFHSDTLTFVAPPPSPLPPPGMPPCDESKAQVKCP